MPQALLPILGLLVTVKTSLLDLVLSSGLKMLEVLLEQEREELCGARYRHNPERTVTRAGFERMVAEVCLGKVGAVAAREVSRFARNSREWQQLVEVCRVVDTVLIDQEIDQTDFHIPTFTTTTTR